MTESPFEPPTAPLGAEGQPAVTVPTRRVVAAAVVGVFVFVVSMAVFWALAIGFTMAWVAALTAALGPEEAVAKPLLVLAPTVVVGFIAHLGAGGGRATGASSVAAEGAGEISLRLQSGRGVPRMA